VTACAAVDSFLLLKFFKLFHQRTDLARAALELRGGEDFKFPTYLGGTSF
jgi:hypothetical protein